MRPTDISTGTGCLERSRAVAFVLSRKAPTRGTDPKTITTFHELALPNSTHFANFKQTSLLGQFKCTKHKHKINAQTIRIWQRGALHDELGSAGSCLFQTKNTHKQQDDASNSSSLAGLTYLSPSHPSHPEPKITLPSQTKPAPLPSFPLPKNTQRHKPSMARGAHDDRFSQKHI